VNLCIDLLLKQGEQVGHLELEEGRPGRVEHLVHFLIVTSWGRYREGGICHFLIPPTLLRLLTDLEEVAFSQALRDPLRLKVHLAYSTLKYVVEEDFAALAFTEEVHALLNLTDVFSQDLGEELLVEMESPDLR